jgi:ATP phosphoribosyltransferase
VAEGLFDVGITGRDWIEERGAEVATLTQLHYSKATARPIRMVLAIAGDSQWQSADDLPAGVRVHTEYPELTRRFLEKHGVDAQISLSYGATEAKIPEIADAVVEITETGRALRAAGLKVLDTILVSHTELIANPLAYGDVDKRKAMEQLQTLLLGALEARGRVLVKLNVEEANLQTVIGLLPALKSPTVSKLFGEDGYAVETVVAKSDINVLIPALKDAGATGILELPISKIVQ